jgi:hypothetical protein
MLSRIPGPKRSAEVIFEQPINVIWEVVTDTGNFHDFMVGAWSWESFDRNRAMVGTSFKRTIARADDNYIVHETTYYIVNWEPPYRFSMGHDPEAWDYDFFLTELGEKTKVRVTRQFNWRGWLMPSQGIIDSIANNLRTKVMSRGAG